LEVKRGRGRPPGSKNRTKDTGTGGDAGLPPVSVSSPEPSFSVPVVTPVGTTRASLEADRDRLLKGIEECKGSPLVGLDGRTLTDADGNPKTWTDWKTLAALQSQLNGVNRMLLRITGETAPTDANLIRSPQYVRLKADLLAVLKKHPAALADVARVFDTAEH
jgi:hypothetical protein